MTEVAAAGDEDVEVNLGSCCDERQVSLPTKGLLELNNMLLRRRWSLEAAQKL